MRIILLDNCETKINQVGDVDLYGITIETFSKQPDITIMGDRDAIIRLYNLLDTIVNPVKLDNEDDY